MKRHLGWRTLKWTVSEKKDLAYSLRKLFPRNQQALWDVLIRTVSSIIKTRSNIILKLGHLELDDAIPSKNS